MYQEKEINMPLVMFIDDCETALALTGFVTMNMPIEVVEYTQAQAALADINLGMTPDLIITDLNMPVMNGLEFLEALRKIPSTKKTPCFILTSEKSSELKEEGKALGLDGWITKPFNATELKQAITRVLKLPSEN